MVHLFYGEESYLLDTKVAEITKTIEEPELNLCVFSEDFEMTALTQAAQTLPFLADKRAVVLRVPELKGDDELKKLLMKLPDSVEFIIATENLDNRCVVYKAFKEQAKSCGKPELDKVVEFIGRVAKKEGRMTGRAAAEEILKRLNYYEEKGITLYAVLGVVRQIAVTSDVTMDAVRATLPDSSAGKAYSLATMLCDGKREALFALAQYLVDSGENEIALIASMIRVFRLAWTEKVGMPTNTPRFQYQTALRFSVAQLSKVQDDLSDATARIKDGGPAGVIFPVVLVKALQTLHNVA